LEAGEPQPPGRPHHGHAVGEAEPRRLVRATEALVVLGQHHVVDVRGEYRPPLAALHEADDRVERALEGQVVHVQAAEAQAPHPGTAHEGPPAAPAFSRGRIWGEGASTSDRGGTEQVTTQPAMIFE